MTLSYIGSFSLGTLTPISLSVASSLASNLAQQIADLGKLTTGIGAFPPSISGSITTLASLLTELNLAITASFPSVDFQALAAADAIAPLSAELVSPLAFQTLLQGEAGIFAYAYSGQGNAFGSSVSSALSGGYPDGSGGSASSNAMIVATTNSGVFTDIETFFGVIPPNLPVGLTYLAQLNIGALCPICVDSTSG